MKLTECEAVRVLALAEIDKLPLSPEAREIVVGLLKRATAWDVRDVRVASGPWREVLLRERDHGEEQAIRAKVVEAAWDRTTVSDAELIGCVVRRSCLNDCAWRVDLRDGRKIRVEDQQDEKGSVTVLPGEGYSVIPVGRVS
jgi:hypothetical protein